MKFKNNGQYFIVSNWKIQIKLKLMQKSSKIIIDLTTNNLGQPNQKITWSTKPKNYLVNQTKHLLTNNGFSRGSWREGLEGLLEVHG